jgi:ABC-type molybdate transport system substrate-binding protein
MPGVFGPEADTIIREQISYIEQGTVDFVFVYGNYSAASLVSQTNAEYEQIYIRENLRSGDGSHYYIYAKVDRIQEDGKG